MMSAGDCDGETAGRRLRRTRLAAGMTQEELANRSGISVRAISDLERDRTSRPYPRSVRLLATALGLPSSAGDELIALVRSYQHCGPAGSRPEPRRFQFAPTNRGLGSCPARSYSCQCGCRGHSLPLVVPQQLPPAVGYFVGREAELTSLMSLLGETTPSAETVPMLAISGAAGVGKSALAVRWAHEVAGQFPDGQIYVDLRRFGRTVSANKAICSLLEGFQVPADRIPVSPEAQIGLYRSLLAGRRVLVVLDNAQDTAQVTCLLPASPSCVVVFTSRAMLTGLAAVYGASPIVLSPLTEAQARALLTRRIGAQRVAAEREAVTELIALCAGLPAALNVVAVHVVTHGGTQLAALVSELRNGTDWSWLATGREGYAKRRQLIHSHWFSRRALK